TPDAKRELSEMARERVMGHIHGRVCVEWRGIAEPNQAVILAEEEARRILELLRFSIPMLYATTSAVVIGLQGEALAGSRHTLTMTPDLRNFFQTFNLTGSVIAFELSSSNLE